MFAPTHRKMYEMANQNRQAPALCEKGGWGLRIWSEGQFMLYRYHHIMLTGNVDRKIVLGRYGEMLKTDREGVNRFLTHFDIPVEVYYDDAGKTQLRMKE